jgi:hypothetical protein
MVGAGAVGFSPFGEFRGVSEMLDGCGVREWEELNAKTRRR